MKSNVFFILSVSIGALVYFLILNGQIVFLSKNILYFGAVNFISISHTSIAFFQLGLFVLFLQGRVSKHTIRSIVKVVLLIIIVDLFALALMKKNAQLIFYRDFYFSIHKLIVFIDTGILAVFYFVLSKFIHVHSNASHINYDNMKKHAEPRNFKWYLEVFIVILGHLLTLYLLNIGECKMSAVVYTASLFVIGFIKKWNQSRLSKIPVGAIWAVYIFAVLLGLVGGWYDFFTGFLFFYTAFGVLIFTSSQKAVTLARLLLSIATLCFGTLFLIFHFMYSLD